MCVYMRSALIVKYIDKHTHNHIYIYTIDSWSSVRTVVHAKYYIGIQKLYPTFNGITNRNKSLFSLVCECVCVPCRVDLYIFILFWRCSCILRCTLYFFSVRFSAKRWWDNFLLFIKKSKLSFIVMRHFFANRFFFDKHEKISLGISLSNW